MSDVTATPYFRVNLAGGTALAFRTMAEVLYLQGALKTASYLDPETQQWKGDMAVESIDRQNGET